jgi:hypothetical protein
MKKVMSMKKVILTIALLGFVFGGYAHDKKGGYKAKVIKHKTTTSNKSLKEMGDKIKSIPKTPAHDQLTNNDPVYIYRENGKVVKSPAASSNSELISFSSEGTYTDCYPRSAKRMASK